MSPSVTAIIPFFGGTSRATNSLEETRLQYLDRTLDSLEVAGWKPIIGQSGADTVEVPCSVRLDVDPIWLPWALMCWAQKNVDTDLVYVTEADQVLHVGDEGILEIPGSERYLAPWRLDVVSGTGECESPEAHKYVLGGQEYSISNGGGHIPVDPSDPWGVVPVRSAQGAFSGAFLATSGFFRGIKFRKMRLLPVEHATGLDAKSAGDCVKTVSVERCWIDHLSPRDRWEVKV